MADFLDQFSEDLRQSGLKKPEEGDKESANKQGEATGDNQQNWFAGWTQEQIAAYYQQYGYNYNDYAQYYNQGQAGSAQQKPKETPKPAANYDSGYSDSYGGYGGAGGAGGYGGGFGGGYGGGGFGGGGRGGQQRDSGEPTRSVWVGNLHPDTTETELRNTFGGFGMIESIKILPAKNCAFIRFIELDAAIQAHDTMSGRMLRGQTMKVGWGKPETNPPQQREPREEIGGNPPCRNLWLGNIAVDVNEDAIREAFSNFGRIEKIRMLPAKNCAFVNFYTLEDAVAARKAMQGAYLGGRSLRINFGKDSGPPPAAPPASSGSFSSSSSSPPRRSGFSDRPPSGFSDRGDRDYHDSHRNNDYDQQHNYPSPHRTRSTGFSDAPPSPPRPQSPPKISLPPLPPPEAAPPNDPTTRGTIEKLAEFVARNGAQFEEHTKTKQKDNPKFGFLHEGHPFNAYYVWKLWKARNPGVDPQQIIMQHQQQAQQPPADQYSQQQQVQHAQQQQQDLMQQLHLLSQQQQQQQQRIYGNVPPPNLGQTVAPPPPPQHTGFSAAPQTHQPPPPPGYDSYGNVPPPPNTNSNSNDGLAGVLDNLSSSKESIRVAKQYIMQRPQQAHEAAAFICTRVQRLTDQEQKLNHIYLIHDILHHSSRNREKGELSDEFSASFMPVLGDIFRAGIEGPADNRDKIIKVIRLWDEKRIFDKSTLAAWEELVRSGGRSSQSNNSDRRDREQHREWGRDSDWDSPQQDRKRGRDSGSGSGSGSGDGDYFEYDAKRRH